MFSDIGFDLKHRACTPVTVIQLILLLATWIQANHPLRCEHSQSWLGGAWSGQGVVACGIGVARDYVVAAPIGAWSGSEAKSARLVSCRQSSRSHRHQIALATAVR